jgi:hypothetical protein
VQPEHLDADPTSNIYADLDSFTIPCMFFTFDFSSTFTVHFAVLYSMQRIYHILFPRNPKKYLTYVGCKSVSSKMLIGTKSRCGLRQMVWIRIHKSSYYIVFAPINALKELLGRVNWPNFSMYQLKSCREKKKELVASLLPTAKKVSISVGNTTHFITLQSRKT